MFQPRWTLFFCRTSNRSTGRVVSLLRARFALPFVPFHEIQRQVRDLCAADRAWCTACPLRRRPLGRVARAGVGFDGVRFHDADVRPDQLGKCVLGDRASHRIGHDRGLFAHPQSDLRFFDDGPRGLFLYIDRPTLLLVIPPLAAVQTWRARNESRVLQAKFGEAYSRYKAGTWF
jgi:hypothetical protein